MAVFALRRRLSRRGAMLGRGDVRGSWRLAHHLALINFIGRQALDTVAPSNFLVTNPVALKETARQGGMNLIRGAINYAADLQRLMHNERSAAAKAFTPGETVAVTKGAVVARTGLAEIIQYEPSTGSVRAEPVVIVPAWIMKYYVLDLRPRTRLSSIWSTADSPSSAFPGAIRLPPIAKSASMTTGARA